MIEGVERNCWYWYTDPREGDVWYPCWVADDGLVLVDGRVDLSFGLDKALTLVKATMPS